MFVRLFGYPLYCVIFRNSKRVKGKYYLNTILKYLNNGIP